MTIPQPTPREEGRRSIPIAGPWITQREVDAVAWATEHSWYEHAYDSINEFEARFAEYCSRRFAIALPSCTSGIHLSLAASGIGPGDEVIVPESTWIATASPITYVGAQPVFVDVDRRDWCLDVAGFEAAITERTRAVVVVDLYGGMPAMDRLVEVAARHGIVVIEDAAEAVGSTFRGRRAGGFGAASVFSFHGTKTLTTHEGGMVLTDDEALHDRMLRLRDQGRAPGAAGDLWNLEVGFKYRMSAMQAAIGVVQLDRVDELVGRKREILSWYRERLGPIDGITLNPESDDVVNSYWMTTALFDPQFGYDGAAIIAELGARSVVARPFFHPLSSLPAYQGFPGVSGASIRHPVSYEFGARGVNLPSALSLVEDDIEYVCRALLGILGASAR